jgi:ubiquinone/menaquinone biosynthesis C-methylase UbiE
MQILNQAGVEASSFVLSAHDLPIENESIDVLISFYSLEHMHPLEIYLTEFKRVLRPGGLLAGAIPCEGGLAWGGGRLITTRRYIQNNSEINPDKIICWEHPNYADHVLQALASFFSPIHHRFWPLRVPLVDINLICGFVYQKEKCII